MVWFRRFAWSLTALLMVVLAAVGIYLVRSMPALDGTLRVPGLHKTVQVQRDASDVTHIKAQSTHDALFTLGYVHAQERGWQLEFNRRVMRGQLSEVFGDATLDTDKLMRTLGIVQAAQKQWDGLPQNAKDALQAYADGINAFHSHGKQALSPEFHILRVEPGTWLPQDSVGWTLMMALDLGGNWGTEFARLSAAQVMDTQRLWQLLPPYAGEKPAATADLAELYHDLGVYRDDGVERPKVIAAAKAINDGVAQWSDAFANQIGNVEGKGSNNWVVAGTHTTSGKPLLANDPHLGLGAPAIWYFARIQSPEFDTIGATLPGFPYVVLGRTAKVAWGFTNTGPDVQDLYLEHIHPDDPTLYQVPDIAGKMAWQSFQTRKETVKVKGKADVEMVVRETRHGPVLSDVQKSHADLLDTGSFVIALRWSALDADNRTVLAAIEGSRAQSVDDIVKAYAHYHSPMQNLVVADDSGKILYKAVGKVPVRRADNNIMGLAPAPGWDPRYDWAGWLDIAQTPQDTGTKGWVATANQRITPPNYKPFMGQDWAVSYRFDRIESLLAATPRHDVQSMQRIQADTKSLATLRLLPILQKTQSSHPLAAAALASLAQFDGVMRPEQAAPLVFSVWVDELTRGLLAPKLGEAKFKSLYGKRHFRSAVEGILEHDNAWWCAPMRCEEQSSAALDRALQRLQHQYGADVAAWTWGRAHFAKSSHQPFDNVAMLAPYFDVMVPTGGDSNTVNVGHYWPNDAKTPFANRHAASLRAVYDLADLEKSQFIYQTGQSGLVFSDRYRDMRDAWARVQYRPLQMQPTEWRHTQTLNP
ncbi:MAG: penicillin acylase family protein [Rhodoferax sp.]|nr:penicillin acylase family protein [Rhodoferax sp.]